MHGEWEDHRSSDRYFKNIMAITESGVLRSRTDEVVLVTSFAAFIVCYNAIAGGLTDFDLIKHGALIPHLPLLGLPLSFFTLTGSSLGLLLVAVAVLHVPEREALVVLRAEPARDDALGELAAELALHEGPERGVALDVPVLVELGVEGLRGVVLRRERGARFRIMPQ